MRIHLTLTRPGAEDFELVGEYEYEEIDSTEAYQLLPPAHTRIDEILMKFECESSLNWSVYALEGDVVITVRGPLETRTLRAELLCRGLLALLEVALKDIRRTT